MRNDSFNQIGWRWGINCNCEIRKIRSFVMSTHAGWDLQYVDEVYDLFEKLVALIQLIIIVSGPETVLQESGRSDNFYFFRLSRGSVFNGFHARQAANFRDRDFGSDRRTAPFQA